MKKKMKKRRKVEVRRWRKGEENEKTVGEEILPHFLNS